MFDFFKKKKPPQNIIKTIKIKLAITSKKGLTLKVVWVSRYAIHPDNIEQTITYMERILKDRNVVLVAKDITVDGMGPVFVGRYANLFRDNTFTDFTWKEIEIPIADKNPKK